MAMSTFLWVQASALCLILTAFGQTGTILVEAEIYCYACNSYLSECGQRVDNSRGTLFRSRCSGRCFTRQGEDNAIYRGCFDGFDDVPTLVDTYNGCRNQTWNNRILLWCICDTNLCNGEDFETMSRSHQHTQLVAASRQGQGQGQSAPSAHQQQRFVSVVHNSDQSELSGAAIDYRYQQPRDTQPQSRQQSRPSTVNNEATSVHGSTYTATRQMLNIVADTAHQLNTERDGTSSSGRSGTSSGGSGTASAAGHSSGTSTHVKHVDRKSGKSGSSSNHDQGEGHGELGEYDMKSWRVEPLYDLPAALLDQGPYIWTPDDRPPHIVERVTSGYQRQHDYNNDDDDDHNNVNVYLKSDQNVQLHDDHDTDGYRNIGSNVKANEVITQPDYDDYNIGNNYFIYEQQQQQQPHAGPLLPREAYQPINYRQTAVFEDPGRAWWTNSVQNIVKQTNGGSPSGNDVTAWESESSTTEWKQQQPEASRVSPSAKKSKDLDPGIVDLNGHFVDPSSIGSKSTSASNEIVKAGEKSSKPEPVKSHYYDVNRNELNQPQHEDNSIMNQARCTSDAGYHLHPSDCRLYYVCIIHHSGLVPIIMRCPLGLLWDDRQKLCVLHSTTCTMPSLPDVTSSPEEANRQDSPWRSGRDPDGQKSSRQIEFVYSW